MKAPHHSERHKVIPAVYLIMRRKDGKVLLIQRQNTGYMDGYYGLPSGHVEKGEPSLAAIIREAKEEVGVDVNAEDIRLVHLMHRMAEERDHERIDMGFETSVWKGEPYNAEPDKCGGLLWADPKDLPKKTIVSVALILEYAAAGTPYSDLNF